MSVKKKGTLQTKKPRTFRYQSVSCRRRIFQEPQEHGDKVR